MELVSGIDLIKSRLEASGDESKALVGEDIRREETFDFEGKDSVPATPVVQIFELPKLSAPKLSTPRTPRGGESTPVKSKENIPNLDLLNSPPSPRAEAEGRTSPRETDEKSSKRVKLIA